MRYYTWDWEHGVREHATREVQAVAWEEIKHTDHAIYWTTDAEIPYEP